MSMKRYQKLLDEEKKAFDILYEYTNEEEAFKIIEKESLKYLKCLGNCLENSDLDFELNEAIEICDNHLSYIRIDDPISAVFEDTEEAGKEYIASLYDLPDAISDYINYEALGNNLDEPYVELNSGRVVYLNM